MPTTITITITIPANRTLTLAARDTKLKDFLKQVEGFKPSAYFDSAGLVTIGVTTQPP